MTSRRPPLGAGEAVPGNFAAELRRAAAGVGAVPRLVAERPEEWRIGPLTTRVDRARGTAEIRYARQQVARARCDADDIMVGWRRALDRLTASSAPPEQFLAALASQYDALLAAAGRPAGERIPVTELALAVVRAAGEGGSRAQFAWDLARLRRERRLEHDGRRVLIDVATGGTAAKKSQVLWIEDDSGAGQYYLHFRLMPR